jgi:hypothetical protein
VAGLPALADPATGVVGAEPPVRKEQNWEPAVYGFVLFLILTLFGLAHRYGEGWFGGFVLGLAVGIGCLVFNMRRAASVRRWNRDVWPTKYADWEKTWFCRDCEATFVR